MYSVCCNNVNFKNNIQFTSLKKSLQRERSEVRNFIYNKFNTKYECIICIKKKSSNEVYTTASEGRFVHCYCFNLKRVSIII